MVGRAKTKRSTQFIGMTKKPEVTAHQRSAIFIEEVRFSEQRGARSNIVQHAFDFLHLNHRKVAK